MMPLPLPFTEPSAACSSPPDVFGSGQVCGEQAVGEGEAEARRRAISGCNARPRFSGGAPLKSHHPSVQFRSN